MRRARILHKAGFLGIFACLGLLPCGSAVHAATSAPAKQAASPVPVIVVQPAIVANSNPAVPLAAVVTLQARNAIAVDVSVQERLAGRPDRSWRVLAPVASDGSVSLPIVGFRHSSDLTVTIALRSARGTSTPLSNKLTYHAPPVPDVGLSWPKIETVEIDRGRVEPGITFVSVRRNFLERGSLMTPRQRDFQRKFGLIIALNEDGEVVWYYRSLQRIAGIQSMPDGRILMTLADQRTRIIDVLGNVQREYVAGQSPDRDPSSAAIPIEGIQSIHHEPYLTKRGTFIAMSANARRIDNYYTSVTDANAPRKPQMVMGDAIIEYDELGKILWKWDSFDHLDPMRIHFHLFQPYWMTRGFPGHLDWTHGNGVSYDEKNGTIIASLKQMDAIIGISRKTGQIKWIYGNPTGWSGDLAAKVLKPKGRFVRYPFSPHHPHVDGPGLMTYYDNGMFQAFPFTGKAPVAQHMNFSRAARIRIDEKAMTFEEIWTSEAQKTEGSCYNWAMGEAETLPITGNALLIRANCTPPDPTVSDFNEFDLSKRFVDETYGDAFIDQYTNDHSAKRVARYRFSNPDQIISWTLYGGFHRATVAGNVSH
ncbi:aryl-sulfate sulfotransferase [Sphingorhabdus sp.]|uniref:aryl-sulfate sulfotransferase n=1 Tax=Sphingorhabdus sp. TaxID=1902408 RepID=UPI0038FBF368